MLSRLFLPLSTSALDGLNKQNKPGRWILSFSSCQMFFLPYRSASWEDCVQLSEPISLLSTFSLTVHFLCLM